MSTPFGFSMQEEEERRRRKKKKKEEEESHRYIPIKGSTHQFSLSSSL
jgi:hypothetical protein